MAIKALLEARNDIVRSFPAGSLGGIFVRRNNLQAIFAKYIGLIKKKEAEPCALNLQCADLKEKWFDVGYLAGVPQACWPCGLRKVHNRLPWSTITKGWMVPSQAPSYDGEGDSYSEQVLLADPKVIPPGIFWRTSCFTEVDKSQGWLFALRKEGLRGIGRWVPGNAFVGAMVYVDAIWGITVPLFPAVQQAEIQPRSHFLHIVPVEFLPWKKCVEFLKLLTEQELCKLKKKSDEQFLTLYGTCMALVYFH